MSSSPADDASEDVYDLLNRGLALYAAGQAFEAHEIWEHAWNGEVGRNKLTLQAIIQVAAAMFKHETGNPRGTSKLLAKARDKLAEVSSGASCWLGIDLVALDREIERALAESDAVARGEGTTVAPPALPRAVGRDGLVYLHGFASGPASHKSRVLVPPLLARGFHVEVPDLNEGDFEHLTITRAIARVRRMIRERTILIGSSLGGYVAALVAARDERVKGLVLMAPAFDFGRRLRERYGESAIDVWRRRGRTEVEHYTLGGKHPIGYGLVEDGDRHPGRPPIRVPTHIVQGRRDDVVTPDLAEAVAREHPALVELELVDDDHGLVASASRVLDATNRMIERVGLTPG